jgi:hypothetical protein
MYIHGGDPDEDGEYPSVLTGRAAAGAMEATAIMNIAESSSLI